MAIYMVEGKLGSGKSLIAVSKMRDAMRDGLRVATNLNLFVEKLLPGWSKYDRAIRLPDWPSVADLNYIGRGSDSLDESKFGALVLDELGTWLNARAWGDKGRQALIDWLLHSRKLGWNVYLIAQNVSMLDKQIRDALTEFRVICKRTDRIGIPLIGGRLPRVHIAFVKYGVHPGAPTAEKWIYRGKDVQDGYDTRQVFIPPDVELDGKVCGPMHYLSPFRLTRERQPRKGFVRLRELGEEWRRELELVWPHLFEWVRYAPGDAESEDRLPVAVTPSDHRKRRLERLKTVPEFERWRIARDLVERGIL